MYLLTIFGDTKTITRKKIDNYYEFEFTWIDYLDNHHIQDADIDRIIYTENDEVIFKKSFQEELKRNKIK